MKYTIEEIKKELSSYIQEKKYIEEKKADIKELEEQATNVTSVLSDMPKGSNPVQDRIAEYVAKILDLQAENYQYLLNLEKKKQEIENIINMMEQPYKNILYFRYIKGYNLTEVASMIGNEYKWCCVLHGKALEQYRRLKEVRR